MSSSIVLFDIPRKVQGRSPSWSPNTLKIRFALNYKRLPFETIWVEFPDIAPTLKNAGFPGTDEPRAYSVPAIIDRSSSPPNLIIDSLAIAEYLDATYPSRSIFRGSEASIAAQRELLRMIPTNCHPHISALVRPSCVHHLNDTSAEYFRRTREEDFGCKLEDTLAGDKLERKWEDLSQGLDVLATFVDEARKDGKDVLLADDENGKTEPTYAGFVLAAAFAWLERVGTEGAWDRVRELNDGLWATVWDAAQPYIEE